jgi:guanylate kinase
LLEKCNNLEKLKSYTTKDLTSLKENDWYNYISLDEFHSMCANEELFESTMYAGHGYGSKIEDVNDILAKGKHVLTTMDICGAMALKTNFSKVITVYIKRDRRTLIESILKKNSSIEDKVNRLICIEDEKNNEDICDYVISYDTYDDAVDEIISTLNL